MKWKSLSVDERYEQYTKPYYFEKDNENQPQEFFDEADELAVTERNMDCVCDYAYEKAELDEPPKELVKHFAKLERFTRQNQITVSNK